MTRHTQKAEEPNDGTLERIGEQIGGATGRAVGRGAEIAGGMMGSMVDTMMATLGDWWSTSDAKAAASSFDRAEPTCRNHFESQSARDSGDQSQDFTEVRPLYQFGYVASRNPIYEGRDFKEVEPDLERAWDRGSRPEDWADVRSYVDFGYTRDRVDRLDL